MKKSVTYTDFGVGMDRRKDLKVSDPNRLWTLKNAHITTGRYVQKRPGLTKVADLEAGTKGLFAANGKLNTFTTDGALTHANSLFLANQIVGSNVSPPYFNGTGLNDLDSSGGYTGSGTPEFTIEIDGVTVGTITAFADAGGGKTRVTSSANHGLSNGTSVTISGTTNYNGTWSISNAGTNLYDISVAFVANDATGTWEKHPNTFEWKKDGLVIASLVPITGAVQTLQEGVSVTFNAIHGHTLGDSWSIQISSVVNVSKIYFADTFSGGNIYVAAGYDNQTLFHHYLDGTVPPRITDPNCPHSRQVAKLSEKMWAGDEDVVRFSGTGLPRDWSSSGDAGFLPTGQKQKGAEIVTALGQYQLGKMVVFHQDGGSQLWDVDPDPINHNYRDSLEGIQTIYSQGIAPLFRDLYVVTESGIRSISEAELVDSESEIDVGSPIDNVIEPLLNEQSEPLSFFYSGEGQFWTLIRQSDTLTTAFVFSFSLTSKVSAWSLYEFPVGIDDVTSLKKVLYFRAGDAVYKFDKSVFQDDGADIECEVQIPFLDAKQPGILKYWNGFDAVVKGTCDVSYLYDPNDVSKETLPIQVSDDTRPGELTPVEISSTSLSLKAKHKRDEDFQLNLLSLFYDVLGAK